jgi:hypothetical protein
LGPGWKASKVRGFSVDSSLPVRDRHSRLKRNEAKRTSRLASASPDSVRNQISTHAPRGSLPYRCRAAWAEIPSSTPILFQDSPALRAAKTASAARIGPQAEAGARSDARHRSLPAASPCRRAGPRSSSLPAERS